MASQKPIMTADQEWIFQRTGRLPALLTARQAAAVLGFREHHIGILIRAGLLTSLGPRTGDYAFDEVTIQAFRTEKKSAHQDAQGNFGLLHRPQ